MYPLRGRSKLKGSRSGTTPTSLGLRVSNESLWVLVYPGSLQRPPCAHHPQPKSIVATSCCPSFPLYMARMFEELGATCSTESPILFQPGMLKSFNDVEQSILTAQPESMVSLGVGGAMLDHRGEVFTL